MNDAPVMSNIIIMLSTFIISRKTAKKQSCISFMKLWTESVNGLEWIPLFFAHVPPMCITNTQIRDDVIWKSVAKGYVVFFILHLVEVSAFCKIHGSSATIVFLLFACDKSN